MLPPCLYLRQLRKLQRPAQCQTMQHANWEKAEKKQRLFVKTKLVSLRWVRNIEISLGSGIVSNKLQGGAFVQTADMDVDCDGIIIPDQFANDNADVLPGNNVAAVIW